MFPFLKSTPLLDETSVEWMFDSFAWALRNFDAPVFFNESILVTPSNAHFPGNESSAESMATLILRKVQEYAGMQHWPTRLVDPDVTENLTPPAQLQIEGPMRGSAGNN